MAKDVELEQEFSKGGRKYRIYFEQVTLEEAVNRCESHGKTLANISSFAELQELKNILMEMYLRDFEGTVTYPDRIFLGELHKAGIFVSNVQLSNRNKILIV